MSGLFFLLSPGLVAAGFIHASVRAYHGEWLMSFVTFGLYYVGALASVAVAFGFHLFKERKRA